VLYICISTNTLYNNSTYTERDILSASRRDFPLLMALRKGTKIAYFTAVVFVFIAVIATVLPLCQAGGRVSCKQAPFPYLINIIFVTS
jgi:hypothetical protein